VTRTNPLTLVLLAVLGGGATWFFETAMVASGRPVLIPPYTLPIALILIGIIIVFMALPVFKVARGKEKARIDPFYATRVVVLAKASSMSGALIAGAGLGIAGFLLTRSVVPGVGSVTMAVATAVGAIVLVVAGLVAEYMCTIPPEDEDKPGSRPGNQGTT
jgi:hypothetical protein